MYLTMYLIFSNFNKMKTAPLDRKRTCVNDKQKKKILHSPIQVLTVCSVEHLC